MGKIEPVQNNLHMRFLLGSHNWHTIEYLFFPISNLINVLNVFLKPLQLE